MMGWAGTWLGGFLGTTEPSAQQRVEAESVGSGTCEGDMAKPLVGETGSPMPRPAPEATNQHEEGWVAGEADGWVPVARAYEGNGPQ